MLRNARHLTHVRTTYSVCARKCVCISKSAKVVSLYVHIISLTILFQYFYTSGRTVSCIIVSLNLGNSNVYLIVLFFIAEKTVQKDVQQMLNSHFLFHYLQYFLKMVCNYFSTVLRK